MEYSNSPVLEKNASISVTAQAWAWLKSADKLVLIFLLILVTTAFHSTQVALDGAWFAATSLYSQKWYFLSAFAIAAYMQAARFELLLTRVFDTTTVMMIVMATMFGGLSPLCSCTVIPLIAVLLRSGIPLSAVMAFWISSPIISPNMYVYTAAILGFEFATFKLGAALFMGLFAGFVTHWLEARGYIGNPLKGGEKIVQRRMGKHQKALWAIWQDKAAMQLFWREFVAIGVFLVKWMSIAFFLEFLMMTYVPGEALSGLIGGQGFLSIIVAALVGIPTYLNGVAAVPLIDGLIKLGISPGAAMSFLVAGSVTSIPASMAVYSIVNKKVFTLYITLGLVGTIISAYAFHAWILFNQPL
jgi:uncharacterized membrane protein YraQ (UPF0718 family)